MFGIYSGIVQPALWINRAARAVDKERLAPDTDLEVQYEP